MRNDKPMPVYEKIKSDVLDNIDQGLWRPGDRIPSEHELVKQFGVSRMTVNRAMRELSDAGRLLRIPGTGTFVAQPDTDSSLLDIQSVDEYIVARGGVHRSQLLRLDRVAADKDNAPFLELDVGEDLFHIAMLHFDGAVPLQLEDRYVNAGLVPAFQEQDFLTVTPSRYLVDEVPVTKIEHTIEAVLPSAEEARRLCIDGGEPCLVLRRRTWWNSTVVTSVRLVSPGSLFSLSGRFKPFSRR
jgi:GntR family histidine utilization transcriptional repressor